MIIYCIVAVIWLVVAFIRISSAKIVFDVYGGKKREENYRKAIRLAFMAPIWPIAGSYLLYLAAMYAFDIPRKDKNV